MYHFDFNLFKLRFLGNDGVSGSTFRHCMSLFCDCLIQVCGIDLVSFFSLLV